MRRIKVLVLSIIFLSFFYTCKKNENGSTKMQLSILSSGTTADLYSVYFVNTNTGYAVGAIKYTSDIILKTIDGGSTWRGLSFGAQTLQSVCFNGVNNGYIVGEYSKTLKTIDGGNTWDTLPMWPHYYLQSVFFTSPDTGYAGGQSYIIKTTDGGINWKTSIQIQGYGEYIISIYFTDTNTGYALGRRSIYKTTDAGISWELLSYKPTQSCNSIYFVDANRGYIVGDRGLIVKTADGGATWTIVSNPTIQLNYTSIYFIGQNRGYIVGDGIILKSIDKGENWAILLKGGTTLHSVFFPNPHTGYAVGDFGTIVKIED